MRTAIRQCPADEFKESMVDGVPPLTSSFSIVPESELGALTEDHVALTATFTAKDGMTVKTAAVFQRRGRVMAALYGDEMGPLLPYAAVLAGRLAALSPADTGE